MEGRGVVIGLLMVLLMMSAEVMHSEATVSCTTVSVKSAGCISFVRGGAKPLSSSTCCKGVRDLDTLASAALQNRRDICTCLQNTAKILQPIPSAVAALSGICGATHPFSLTQNCATIP